MKNLQIYLLLTFFAFQWVQAQTTIDLKEFTTFSELLEEEGELISGWTSFSRPKDFEPLIGKRQLPLNYLTSNYEPDFFRTKSTEIRLVSPVTQELYDWGKEHQPGLLVLKHVPDEQEYAFEIIGWLRARVPFPVTYDLFPEYKALNLINFDLPENHSYFEDNEVVAGDLELQSDMGEEDAGDTQIWLNYPTSNFGEHHDLFMTYLELENPFSDLILDWIEVNGYGTLMFRKGSSGKYSLMGYSKVPFFFHELSNPQKD